MYATIGDHDTTTRMEVQSILRRIRPYWNSLVYHPNYTMMAFHDIHGKMVEVPINDLAILELLIPLRFANPK